MTALTTTVTVDNTQSDVVVVGSKTGPRKTNARKTRYSQSEKREGRRPSHHVAASCFTFGLNGRQTLPPPRRLPRLGQAPRGAPPMARLLSGPSPVGRGGKSVAVCRC